MRSSRFFKVLIISLLSLMLTGVAAVIGLYFYLRVDLPDVEVLKDIHLQVPLRVYTADGKLIAQFGAKRRIPVPLQDVPDPMIKAVLATEDARFYKHPGVDFIGVARAAMAVALTGRKVQGASTITMQVARNFYLSREKTFTRKFREMLLALKIDQYLDKDKILELYLNKIYFGNRAYGVAAAAEVYYGKNLKELSLAQMALLAGLPQAPSRNNPLKNPEAAVTRRNHVLSRMLDLGFITKKQYQQAIREPQTASYHSQRIEVSAPYVSEMVREAMVQEFGKTAYERGLSVYTTIHTRYQLAAQDSLQQGLMDYDTRHGYRRAERNLSSLEPQAWLDELEKEPLINNLVAGAVISVYPQSIRVLLADSRVVTVDWDGLSWARERLQEGYVGPRPESASDVVAEGDVVRVMPLSDGHWRLAEVPEVQGAIVSLNPQNGAILALSGGFDYNVSNFNRAIQAQRQPGSNFKPFIYSAALDKGFTLASIINDAPIVERNPTDDSVWRPMNDNLKFYGPTPLRVGLEQSRNLVSIRLLRAIRVPYAVRYVQRFGFDVNGMPHGLSLALGTASVTPMQLANGYAVFANGGYLVTPYFINKIVDQHGEILYQADPALACQACITTESPDEAQMPDRPAPRVITPQNAYIMTQALRGVIQEGTGHGASVLGRRDLAGKTGTTNDQVDAWFSGFNSHIVTTVWVGFDSMRSLHEYGAEAALPIWIRYMRVALNHMPEATMPEPMDIIRVRIDPRTGLLALPSQTNARFEVFMKSNAPTQYSTAAAQVEQESSVETEELF
jgi:penicillin-binding protein 1A